MSRNRNILGCSNPGNGKIETFALGVLILVISTTWARNYPNSWELDPAAEHDINLVKRDLPDFQRPDFKQIPYLIQRVNHDLGKTDYLLPPQSPGQVSALVAFTRWTLDTHLSILVFPTGFYEWSEPIQRKYVVLRRHSKKTPVYFLTYAYVRASSNQESVEWSVEELQRKPKQSRMEFEICRGDVCSLPEWILGTCTVLSHSCHIQLTPEENETIHRPLKEEEQDEDVFKSFGNIFKEDEADSSSGEDSEKDEEDDEEDDEGGGWASQLAPPSSSSQLAFRRRRKRHAPAKAYLVPFPLPNTFDLLFMEKSVYKFRLKRSAPITTDQNLEEMLHILKCNNCQLLADVFKDLEEEVGFNSILGNKFLREYNGTRMKHWRRFPWMRSVADLPYVGYGDCAYMSLDPAGRKPISAEMDDVIDFYLTTLRLDCDQGLKNEIRGWLTSKLRFLRIVQDLSFEVIPTSQLLRYSMLTPQEFEMLTNAILFLKYSTVYRESQGNSQFRMSLLGHPLSAKVSFLTRVIIKIVDLTNQYLQHHMIKMSRYLARMLKDKFYALLLDKSFIKFKKPSRQGHLYRENYRDRIQVMALKEFVLYGLSPIFRSGSSTDTAFNSFYQLNENRIRFLVHSYGFDEISE